MNKLGHIYRDSSSFRAQWGSFKSGTLVELGRFSTEVEAQAAIGDHLRKTMAHIIKRPCIDCGCVFTVRNRPGHNHRKVCLACQAQRKQAKATAYFCSLA